MAMRVVEGSFSAEYIEFPKSASGFKRVIRGSDYAKAS
jgi:hypothetical protein